MVFTKLLFMILFIGFSFSQSNGFSLSTAEKEGVDQEELDAIHNEISTGVYGLIDHFLVIRNGKKIFEKSYEQDYESIVLKYDTTNFQFNYDHPQWHPYYKNTKLHSMQSVTKSVTSAIMGIAIDKGLVPPVSTKAMLQFFPKKYNSLSNRKKAITIEDLLTMRSGFEWDEANYNDAMNDCIIMENKDDWISYVVNKPMDEQPGTVYEYNSGASVLLGKIVRNGTGERIDEFGKKHLFEPLGIKEFYWKITPMGEIDTEGGLYLKAEDLAKIGFLFMNNGKWEGQQIISEDWVKQSLKPHVLHTRPNNSNSSGYGYQWWVPKHDGNKADIFAGNGYGGQFLFVVPEKDLIVVLNGWNIHDRPKKFSYNILQKRILPTLKN